MKKLLVALVAICGIAVVAHADTPKTTTGTAIQGEFGGHCAMALAAGKQVMTDCKINWKNDKTGKTYCFSSEAMKTDWAKNTDANLMKADAQYKTIAATHAATNAAAAANASAKSATDAAKASTDAAAAAHKM